jgi:hypothetical protein
MVAMQGIRTWNSSRIRSQIGMIFALSPASKIGKTNSALRKNLSFDSLHQRITSVGSMRNTRRRRTIMLVNSVNITAALCRHLSSDFTQPFHSVIMLFIHKDFLKVPTG